jgi:ubiquinone/menaquinone biosynthesis C-methylase UbiE
MSTEDQSFKDHFSQVAAQYAQFRPVYPQALFIYLGEQCASRRCVWDCACGNGQASLDLAEVFEQVIATDGSAAQIAAARPHPRVEYRVAPAEACGLPAGSVDLVTVAQALHWLDVPRFYAEASRVLRPGGVLAVWSYGRLEVEGAEVDAIVQRFYRDVIGPFWPPGREHVDNGYRDLAFPVEQLPAPQFNIDIRWTLPHFCGYVRSWSATARYIQQRGDDPVVSLTQQLTPLWEQDAERLIRWPLALRCGRIS